MSKKPKKYTVVNFLFDAFMFCITCGVPWLIWIFVREMRGLRR